MKKFLITVIVALLAFLTFSILMQKINIGKWESKSIEDIQDLNADLETEISKAKKLNSQEYPASIEKLESAFKTLEKSKEKYENKVKYISDNVELGIVEIKEYKIERLWIALENYAKEEGIELKLDVVATPSNDVYDLDITLVGEYMGIMDFIYDIEKDDTLGFKILNFKIEPYSKTTTTDTTNANGEDDSAKIKTVVDVNKLKATFKIEGVGIEFN